MRKTIEVKPKRGFSGLEDGEGGRLTNNGALGDQQSEFILLFFVEVLELKAFDLGLSRMR